MTSVTDVHNGDVTSGLPLDRQQPDRRRLVGADRLFEVCDRGVSVCVDSAVWRHARIAFGPQLTLDDSLRHPPKSEQQAPGTGYLFNAASAPSMATAFALPLR